MKDRNDSILLLLQNPEFKQWILHPTDESNYYWENWLEHHPDNQEDVDKARELIIRLRFHEDRLADKETEEIIDNIISREDNTSPTIISFKKIIPIKYAAVLALILGLGALIGRFYRNEIQYDHKQLDITYITKLNPPGQKSIIRLKDGTEVHLNSNSSLKYAEDFGSQNRTVELKGEAFFSVATDKKKPFTVISGNVHTTALGTHFNVNARNENKPRIILTEGMIKVEDNLWASKPIILSPYQSIDYDSDKGFLPIKNIKNLNEILWIQGVLKFENTPLVKVIKELENWYGVSITLEGEHLGLTYSGEFKDEYLTNILKSMSYSLGMEYSQENEFVQLKIKER